MNTFLWTRRRLVATSVIALAILGLSVGVILTEFAKRDQPNNSPVRLPHENDCTKFYECRQGKKILSDCPVYNEENDTLHFNPNLRICDWPEHANCKMPSSDGNTTDPTTSSSTSPPPNDSCIGTCPVENILPYSVVLPHEDCTKFCLCSESVAYVLDCREKFPYWSDDMKRCARSDEVVCSNVMPML